MTVETVSYISDLNVSLPANTDSLGETDDHIKNIKVALKQSFPNINGAVTLTEEEINGTIGRLSALEAEDNTFFKRDGSLPMAGNLGCGGFGVFNVNNTNTWALIDDHEVPNGYTLRTAINYAIVTALQMTHPVGHILMNHSGANPASYLGFGSWVPWAQAKFVAGVGSNVDSNGTPATWGPSDNGGGEYNHTLVPHEIPDLTVHISANSGGGVGGSNLGASNGGALNVVRQGYADGGNGPHNNIPPFCTAYFWKRIA